ncbi:MAG TPA: polysaccharide biosynthesis C-terminal domain-containing protein [Candidatus Woesebacteria bacterium]|nr:polysaccharide biosynthesis C-terminal domain-containing protein [Candidatus Woesebacteria bacterium]
MLKRIAKNTGIQIFGRILTLTISLVTTGLLTRKLGSNIYGGLVLISSMTVLLDSLADFGTKIIGVREISKGKNKWSVLWWFRMMMSSLAIGIGLVVIGNWQGFREVKLEASLAMLMIYLSSTLGWWEIWMQSKLRMDLKVIIDVIYPLFWIGWLVVLWNQITLLGVVGSQLVARVMSLVVARILLKKNGFEWQKAKVMRTDLISLGKIVWPMGMFMLVFAAYDRFIDSLIIRQLLGLKEVAYYGLGYKIYGNLLLPASFWINSVFPLLARKNKNTRIVIKKSLEVLLIMAGVIVGGTWIMAPVAIKILGGSEYWPTIDVLRILSLALIFAYISHLIGFYLISKGKQKSVFRYGLFSLVFNLGFNLLIIPHFGIKGAALVTVLTEFFGLIVLGFYSRQK